MKIAMTHVDLPNEAKGGVAHQVHYLANAISDHGHEVTMFTFSPPYADCRYEVRQLPTRLARPNSFLSFLLAYRLARTDFSSFDIVHTNGDNYLLRHVHPQVRTFYGSARDETRSAVRTRRRIYQRFIAYLDDVGGRVADVNVGISEATRVQVPTVTKIIPCGVDLNHFRPAVKSERPSILFVGTTGGRKRGSFLAEIFTREIQIQFPDAELWMVAEKPLSCPGIIDFGKVSLEKLVELYQRAWIFCLPSTYEGFGVPYIEAMAAGTPVIASPNPGAKEVLCGGEFGVLAEDNQLGTAIISLLTDPDMRRRYIAKGLERARDFDWEKVACQYERLYASLIA